MRPRPSRPRRGRRDRPPDGHRAAAMPSAPASSAPRSPARRGTQASPAPVASTRSPTAVSSPGVSAARSPTSTTAPGVRSSAPSLLRSAASRTPSLGLLVAGQAGSTAASVAGRGRRSACRTSCASPSRGSARHREHRHARGGPPCAAAGTGSPIPPPAPARPAAPADAFSRPAKVTPPRLRRTAGHPGAEEGRLLGRVRPGAEVDVVGAQRESGELRVGVGVGVRSAGHRPAPRPRRCPGPRADRRRPTAIASVQDAGCSTPSASADQRPGDPVALADVGEGEPALVAVPLLVDLRVGARPAGGSPRRPGGRCAARSRPRSARRSCRVETRSNGRARNR